MNASRIFYIDALKAIAIVLVVMGHTNVIWEVGGSNSVYLPILSVFHIPLFMALSGYVTNVETFNLAKRAKMLIPFFVFGFAWTAFVQLPIGGFFTSEAKYGYWYLYVLFAFFVFLSLIRAMKRNLYIGMGLVQIGLMGLHFMFHRTITGTTISTDHMFQLWPFFCLGIILRRGLLNKIYSHKIKVLTICSLGVVGIWGGQIYFRLTETLLIYTNDLMSFFIVPMLFVVFHEAEVRFKGTTNPVKKTAKSLGHYIGINTLQIYVLQYFAINLTEKLVCDVLKVDLSSYELLLSPVLAVIICLLCVLVTEVLYKVKLGFVFGR